MLNKALYSRLNRLACAIMVKFTVIHYMLDWYTGDTAFKISVRLHQKVTKICLYLR